MVERLLRFLGREIAGLHEAAYLLAFFTLLSQLLGILRDRLLAHQFGAGVELDLYFAAFRIPDIIFVSAASVVSVSVLVPFLVERLERDGGKARSFIDAIFTFFAVFITVVSVVTFFLTPALLNFLFPALSGGPAGDQLLELTRIMLLSPLLLGFSNLLASIAQTSRRFSAYALSPVLYNAGIIVGVIVFYPLWGLSGLAFGVVLGALLHPAVQIPFVARQDLLPAFRLPIHFSLIKDVAVLSFSRTLTLSANQIAATFLVALAAGMASGSVAVFNFSWNLQSVPLALFGVSYTVALFPTISRLFNRGDKEEFASKMSLAARHIIFWVVPVTVVFIVLRAQIVRVVLGSGLFDWQDTRLTAAALALFVVSVLPQSLILLFVRGYYAGGNTKKPLIINLISAGLVVLFSFALVKLFTVIPLFRYFMEALLRVPDLSGTAILMLPLGFSAAAIVNASVFWFYFHRRFSDFSRQVLGTFFEVFSASVIIGFVTYKLLDVFDNVFNVNTLVGIFLQGLFSGVIGIAVGAFVLVLLKNKEIKEVWTAFHRKIWRARVIVPEQETL